MALKGGTPCTLNLHKTKAQAPTWREEAFVASAAMRARAAVQSSREAVVRTPGLLLAGAAAAVAMPIIWL
jgi:hypothetical protein